MSNPYESLERVFHEPSRLALMSELCGAKAGLSFAELKQTCGLTDGNLSRHLKVLEQAGAVTIEKSFIGAKPHTQVVLSRQGRKSFLAYLDALEEVLKQASERVKADDHKSVPGLVPKPVKS